MIERPRLTRLLDGSDERIKMLVAPAGYGKTTLAREWLRARTAVWYSCSAASRDVAALSAGLARTAAGVLPGAGEALLERLSVTARPEDEIEVLVSMIAADLAEWPGEAWLVLDDYEAIAGSAPAEDFVERLVLGTTLNLLVLTRRRPAWVSSRRILYGEVFELDRTALAMTDEEARALLAGASDDVRELIGLARGWPAILALASVSGASAPELTSAPHLYRFFAEEIYSRLSRNVRRMLCELALSEIHGRGIAPHGTLVTRAQQAVRLGLERGFVIEIEGARMEIHPLMRSFLEHKLREEPPEVAHSIATRVARDLIAHESWDEAFTIINAFELNALYPELIEASLEPLLNAGRTSTIKSWLEQVPDETPYVRYAAAELAFREGRFHESEVLASAVAHHAANDSTLSARALITAGRAAHVASRLEGAVEYYREARRRCAGSREIQRAAAYGELAASNELEWTHESEELLGLLGPIESLPPADQVVYAGRKINYQSHAGIPLSLEEARRAYELIDFVKDPVARSSFRNLHGYALAMSGSAREALVLASKQLEDAERHRLDFVIPHTLVIEAIARCVLREYSLASELLAEAERRAAGSDDDTVFHIAWAAGSRLHNAQGEFLQTLSRPMPNDALRTKWLLAEIASSYALACAATGQPERADKLAAHAESMTRSSEVQTDNACARAIIALKSGDAAAGLQYARIGLQRATASGTHWCFVSAYRGCPELVPGLLADPASKETMTRLLTHVDDFESLADKTARPGSILSLSPREREVFALLVRGRSNREIGKLLFISPATVKVHVRHIFEKLDVRSRAEAALRAAQLDRASGGSGDARLPD